MVSIRTLRYFIALVQEGNVSAAAESLHVTQPTLSRQLLELEKGFGVQLYERGNKRISLTESGMTLYEYARAIVELADKAEEEVPAPGNAVRGSVYIGAGETAGMKVISSAIRAVSAEYPDVQFHLTSGSAIELADRMKKGLLDFMLECAPIARPGCVSFPLPIKDVWGIAMREDDPLASRDFVTPRDLKGRPVLASRQALKSGFIASWLGERFSEARIPATFTLAVDGMSMAREGLGYAFTYTGVAVVDGVCVKPVKPQPESDIALTWRRGRHMNRASQVFLKRFKEECSQIADAEG